MITGILPIEDHTGKFRFFISESLHFRGYFIFMVLSKSAYEPILKKISGAPVSTKPMKIGIQRK